jgi:ATP-binding cassette subfamily A (ABC1) protein 3
MFFNFLTGLCLAIVSFILTAIPSTCELNVYLRYLFRLFPSYCLGDCFLQLSLCTEGTDCPVIDKNGYDMSNTVSPWHWNTTGGNLTFMAIEAVVYFIIVVMIEVALSYPALMADLNPVQDPGLDYQKLINHEDLDVHAERDRVLGNPHSDEIIRIEQLRKVYPMGTNMFGMLYNIFINLCKLVWKRCRGGGDVDAEQQRHSRQSQDALRRHAQANGLASNDVKVAVQCLTFGIPRGECFGFLGINGAGKTTTLSILSGELTPSSGTAHINGFDIISQQRQIRQLIGYCPQFDALFELLTVQEHLELYARIKGLSKLGKDKFEANIEKKIKELNLTIYRDKLAGSLSGGNKRKLSVAIATIGDPPIVFLDEPSSGMDPVARRFMWKVIARMSTMESRCSVMLTTHSMEEAEALCTRIGVMVNGQLQCLGSAQHLKHRFGQGYEVTLKLQTPAEAAVHGLLSRMRTAGLFNKISPALALEDVEGGKSHSLNDWESYRISRAMLPRIGQVLDNPQRLAGIENHVSHISTNALEDTTNTSILLLEGLLRAEDNGENHVMDAAALAANASMSAQQFAEYWLLEDRFDSLTAFLQTEFGPRAVLIERSSSQACRYRIIRSKAGEEQRNDLADVFAKFEQHKEQLGIHEYSVGQTTLEQIFNQFAAKQHSGE